MNGFLKRLSFHESPRDWFRGLAVTLAAGVFLAFSGAFGGTGAEAAPGIDAATTAGDYVSSMDAASDAFTASAAPTCDSVRFSARASFSRPCPA